MGVAEVLSELGSPTICPRAAGCYDFAIECDMCTLTKRVKYYSVSY